MKIIVNPATGSPIHDVCFQGQQFFNKKEGEVFEPGQLLKFEDDFANFLLDTFGFLQEVEPEKVKQFIEDNKSKKFICKVEGCDFSSNTQIAFLGHSRKHKDVKDEIISAVDIPVAKGVEVVRKVKKGEFDRQKDIDAQATSEGLIGEGLREEHL